MATSDVIAIVGICVGLVVGLPGIAVGYFNLEHAKRAELLTAGKRFALGSARIGIILVWVFFLVWPVIGMIAFTYKEGQPSRSEIVVLLLQFSNFLLYGFIGLDTFRDWKRNRLRRQLETADSALKSSDSL